MRIMALQKVKGGAIYFAPQACLKVLHQLSRKTIDGQHYHYVRYCNNVYPDARFYFWNQSTSSSKPHYNIPDGDWYLKGATADMPNMVRLELAFFDGSTYKKAVRSKNDDLTPKFTINHSVSDGWDTSCCILVPNGTVFSAAKTFKPQISFSADDPYVMFAMTNRSLTLSAVDQRDMINSIISAATGAADFAAFKTAMGAITPATRSLALSEKTLDAPELTEDEPIVKKTTTRKATKKTEEV